MVKGLSTKIYRTGDGGESWNIEYCQNNLMLSHLEITEAADLIIHNKGISHYEPDADFSCQRSSTNNILTKEIRIYPNPSTGIINVESGNFVIDRVTVFSSTGKRLQLKDNFNPTAVTLNLENLDKGMYYITVEDKLGAQAVRKIIIH